MIGPDVAIGIRREHAVDVADAFNTLHWRGDQRSGRRGLDNRVRQKTGMPDTRATSALALSLSPSGGLPGDVAHLR